MHRHEGELPADAADLGEVALEQAHVVAEASESPARHIERVRVAVDAEQRAAGRGCLHNGEGVPTGADGAVDVATAGPHVERGKNLAHHHRHVVDHRRCTHASGSSDSSVSSSKSSTTDICAWKRSGFQISSHSPAPTMTAFPSRRAYSRNDPGTRMRPWPSRSTGY